MNIKANKGFFDIIRHTLFKGSLTTLQVAGIVCLFEEWEVYCNNEDRRRLAYILATVYHETGHRMQPVKEFGTEAYLKSKKYYPWYGRDLVQTTWRTNYQKVKDFIGVDVIANPELIGQMPLSARVAITFMDKGWYTGKKLSNYFNFKGADPLNARRIINGTDAASIIKTYYDQFLRAINVSNQI